jgi:uncharacterized repeat protein (TIGR01451 family)
MRRTLAGVPGLVLGLSCAVAPAATAQTVLHLNSQANDYVGGGVQQTFTAADGTFGSHVDSDHTVSFSFQTPSFSHSFHLFFAPPAGEPLTPGVYEGVTGWPIQSPTHAGLDVSGDGRACNTIVGRFVVHEAVYSGTGHIVQFAADFEQHCGGESPALFGAIRFNSAVPLLRQFSVSGARALEGDSGVSTERFTVFLSEPAPGPVHVSFFTSDGTGEAGVDYAPASGTLTFAPGEVARTIPVSVLGNTVVQADRSFIVNLAGPNGAPIAFGQGTGTIVDDDSGKTAIHVYSDVGDYVGQGQYLTLTRLDGDITAYVDGNHAAVYFHGDDYWFFDMQAPDASPLVVGSYEGARRWPFQDPGQPGLDVSGQGRGCNVLIGRFVVHEIVVGPFGFLTRFAADFEQHCEGREPALFGYVRINSQVPVPLADLSITKSDGLSAAAPGQTVAYTIAASNAGPQPVAGMGVSDTIPVSLSGATWTCVGTYGGSCAASGSGNIGDTVDLPPGSSVTYSLRGTIAPAASGDLINTVSVGMPAGVTDPNPNNNTATDIDTVLSPCPTCPSGIADGTFEAGAPWPAWTIQGSSQFGTPLCNSGCGFGGGTAGPYAGSNWAWFGGTEDAFETARLGQRVTLPAGSDLRLRFQLRIGDVTMPMTDTLVVSVDGIPVATFVEPRVPEPAYTQREIDLTAFGDGGTHDLLFRYDHPDPGNANFTVDDVELVATPVVTDLSITKTDGVTAASPGQEVTYTIVASNAGPSAASGARVTDTLSAALTSASWTCVGSGGGTCSVGGAGSIDDVVNLPVGAMVTYTLRGTVPLSAAGLLSNTASVSPGAAIDPIPGNNSATDIDALQFRADLSITKTDGHGAALPGQALTYTIVASNAGPYPAIGATVTDTVPAEITGATWTCAGANGGTCTASGSGSIADTVNLPVGASVTYTLSGTISPSATGSVSNTASVAPPEGLGDPNSANDSATDTDPLVVLSADNDTPASAKGVQIGSTSTDTLGPAPSDENWFRYSVRAGRSYCVEVDNGKDETSIRDTVLSVYHADATTLVGRNDDIADEPGGALLSRVCSIATSSEDQLANVTAGASGTPGSFRVRVVDTTLFFPWFFSGNGFQSFIVIKNTTGTAHSATVTISSTAGLALGSSTGAVPGNGSYNLQVSAPAPAGFGLSMASGGVSVAHDGPSGSLIANITSVSFGTGVSFDTPASPRQDNRQ